MAAATVLGAATTLAVHQTQRPNGVVGTPDLLFSARQLIRTGKFEWI